MTNKTYSFYNLADGLLTGRTYIGPEKYLAGNIPAGQGAIEGDYNYLTHRVNLESSVCELYSPPQPSPFHEWDWSRGWVMNKSLEVRVTEAKAERYARLLACDWVVAKALEAKTDIPAEWQKYRQDLRDITLQEGFPTTINWPLPPQLA